MLSTKSIVLNKDSQIRDLPLLPLSNSVDAHRSEDRGVNAEEN
jgi:hypothetical protein